MSSFVSGRADALRAPAGIDPAATFQQISDREAFEGVFTRGRSPVSVVFGGMGPPKDLRGLKVWDCGACNGGFSFECDRQEAAEVAAVSLPDLRDLGIFTLRNLLGSQVRFEQGSSTTLIGWRPLLPALSVAAARSIAPLRTVLNRRDSARPFTAPGDSAGFHMVSARSAPPTRGKFDRKEWLNV